MEDLQKIKANIIVLELCKITQLREQLRDTLQHIQGPQDVVIGNSKAAPKKKNVNTTKQVKTLIVAKHLKHGEQGKDNRGRKETESKSGWGTNW